MKFHKLLRNKKGNSVADMLQNTIYLILGAIAFLFFIYIMTQIIFFFWPPPNTNMIAINSITNNIEFASNNFDDMLATQTLAAQNAQMVVIPVPVRLDRNYSGVFTLQQKEISLNAKASLNYEQLNKEKELRADTPRQQAIKNIVTSIPFNLKEEARIDAENAVKAAYAQNAAWFQTNKPSWWNTITQALPSMVGVDDASKAVEATVQQFASMQKEAADTLKDMSEFDVEEDLFEDTVYATYFASIQLRGASNQAAIYEGQTADMADTAHTVAVWTDAGAMAISLGEGVVVRAIAKKAALTAAELAAEATAKQAARQLALKVGTKTAGTDLSWGKIGNLLKRAKAAKESAKDAGAAKRASYGRTALLGSATAMALYSSPSVAEIGCRKLKTNLPFVADISYPSSLNFDLSADSSVEMRTQYVAVQRNAAKNYFILHIFDGAKEFNDYLTNNPEPVDIGLSRDYDSFVNLKLGQDGSHETISIIDEFCLYKLNS